MKRIGTTLLLMIALLALGTGIAYAATIVGTDGPDRLRGTAQNDRIEGRGGDDSITGGPGEDRILAGPGNDFVSVGYDDDGTTPDCVDCGPGRDTVKLTMLKIAQKDVYQNCERAVY